MDFLCAIGREAVKSIRVKIIFLQIISTQVSVYLKSACLVEEFKEMAVLDPLTGIYNRSYFSNIEATSMPALGESIIMFDIDHFKQVNDTKGHPYGDKILIGFANILTDVSKKMIVWPLNMVVRNSLFVPMVGKTMPIKLPMKRAVVLKKRRDTRLVRA